MTQDMNEKLKQRDLKIVKVNFELETTQQIKYYVQMEVWKMNYIFKRIFGTRKIAQDLRTFTA